MRKFAFLLLIAIMPFQAFSQDDRLDEFTFEEEEYKQDRKYFGIGGGYSGSFFMNELTGVNDFMTNNNFGLDELNNNVYHHGVELMSSTVIIPNTRIGFFRYAGAQESTEDFEINGDNVTRRAEYASFMTGVPLEYIFMPFKSFAIIPGIGLGYGTVDFEISQAPGKVDAGNIGPAADGNSYIHKINSSYFFAAPRLNIEYAVSQFTVVRLGAYYLTSFSYDWQYNKEAAANNVPSDMENNGYAIQIGLYIGLFNY